jgi:hypothetical protein
MATLTERTAEDDMLGSGRDFVGREPGVRRSVLWQEFSFSRREDFITFDYLLRNFIMPCARIILQ